MDEGFIIALYMDEKKGRSPLSQLSKKDVCCGSSIAGNCE
jgi:hypothetical protein